MKIQPWSLPALAVLLEVQLGVAATSYFEYGVIEGRSDMDTLAEQADIIYDRYLERRYAQDQQQSAGEDTYLERRYPQRQEPSIVDIIYDRYLERRSELTQPSPPADIVYDTYIQRRHPQNQQAPPADSGAATGSSSGSLQIGKSPTEVNSTVSDACDKKLAGLTAVTNPAGFAGCYNILSFDPTTLTFQSDLRIFAKSPPSGQFAGLDRNSILVILNFPSSTSFRSLQKRAEIKVVARQAANSSQEFQQFSLSGSITTPINMKKLNELQMASLLTPQIAMQATVNGQTFESGMTSDDMALFVTGQFTDLVDKAKDVTNPSTAAAAIALAKGFVLPGTTFGIFPIGFIVTSSWTLIFLIVYGAGTIARFRYRKNYRKRMAASMGWSYNAPGIGKL